MKYLILALLLTGCGIGGLPTVVEIPGPKGDSGAQGANGTNGADGAKGDKGDKGDTGEDGASPAMIKFCPQYVTTYPSVFPEYGICLTNKLFGVYYDGNHAFLAEIVPGRYVSTSPNTCSFTVKANCVIEN